MKFIKTFEARNKDQWREPNAGIRSMRPGFQRKPSQELIELEDKYNVGDYVELKRIPKDILYGWKID